MSTQDQTKDTNYLLLRVLEELIEIRDLLKALPVEIANRR